MEKEYTGALVALGYSGLESRILGALLKLRRATVDEIVEKSSTSRATVYGMLKSFESKGVVSRSDERPATFSLTNEFVHSMERKTKDVYNRFLLDLRDSRVARSKDLMASVEGIFTGLNYTIEQVPATLGLDLNIPSLIQGRPIELFDFVASGEFRIAVAVFDKSKEREMSTLLKLESLVAPAILALAFQPMECLAYAIFVDPGLSDGPRFVDFANQHLTAITTNVYPAYRAQSGLPSFIGVEGTTGIILTEPSSRLLEDYISRLRAHLGLVQTLAVQLRETVNAIETRLLDTGLSIRHITTRFFNREYFPDVARNRKWGESIDRIRSPVQEIVNREKRDLENLRDRYLRDLVPLTDLIKAIESRVFLPAQTTLEREIRTFRSMHERFQRIYNEISAVEDDLQRGLRNAIRGEEIRVNPFLPTVPVEGENVIIDQDNTKMSLLNFIDEIGLQDQRFRILHFSGASGSGKSHLLRLCVMPEAEKRNVLGLYLTCPIQPDFVEGLFHELVHSLPKEFEPESASLGKQQCRSSRDLLHVLRRIEGAAVASGRKGLLLVIDELENAMPDRIGSPSQQRSVLFSPLSLRQIREITQADIVMNTGLILASRHDIFSSYREYLSESPQGANILEPQPMDPRHVESLFRYRYAFWNEPQPECDSSVFLRVTQLAKGNPRNAIRIFREIHRLLRTQRNGNVVKISNAEVDKAAECIGILG